MPYTNQKTDRHNINTGKIDTGSEGCKKVIPGQNTEQITDIHHNSPNAGYTEIPSLFVFPSKSLLCQKSIDCCNNK